MDQFNSPVAIALMSATLAMCGIAMFTGSIPDGIEAGPQGELRLTPKPGQPVIVDGVNILEHLNDLKRLYTNALMQLENCGKTCPPGQYVSQMCNATSPNVCSVCPAGTYSRTHGLDSTCLACKPCGSGTLVSSCDPVTGEPTCEACPSHTFQDLKTHWETECKPCTCPGGSFPIGECIAGEAFECVPNNGIEVLPSHGCPASSWRLTGKEKGCYNSTTFSGTGFRLNWGEKGGDNFDIFARSRVRFASGSYQFTCRVDDCCTITLKGHSTDVLVQNNCAHTSTRRASRFLEGTYIVEYKAHEKRGGFAADFRIERV